MGELATIVTALRMVLDQVGSWFRTSAKKKEYLLKKLLFNLEPNETITAEGIFLRFWGDAIEELPLPPVEASLRARLRYWVKKRRMPFKNSAEVERTLFDMHERGIVELDAPTRGWRLLQRSSGSARFRPRWWS